MALINGNNSNNVLAGAATDDQLFGFGGDDFLSGLDGADRLFGDLPGSRSGVTGNDILSGGPGGDLIVGGPGFDIALFEGPRRAYTGQATVLDFSQFEQAGGAGGPQYLTGFIMATGPQTALQVDLLLEVEELRFPDGRIVFNPDDPVGRVYRVFEAGLDRAPDPIALNALAAQLSAGAPLSAVADAVAQSAEFQARYGALGNEAFVQQLYQNAFGRAGEAEGVAAWTNALNAGAATRAGLVASFAASPEAAANVARAFENGIWDQDEEAAQVARLYDAAFNRAPDFAGFQLNKAALESGSATLGQLAAGFVGGPEGVALYGGPDAAPEAFVSALYANTLNRPADAAGLATWTQQLASGATTRGQVLVDFSESPEHQLLMLPSIEGGIVFA